MRLTRRVLGNSKVRLPLISLCTFKIYKKNREMFEKLLTL
jgi:hypothetical protein